MLTATACTATVTAFGAKCGEPAVRVFAGTGGEVFAECEAHAARTTLHVATTGTVETRKRYCRKAVCVEAAMGYERVVHLAGTCVTR
jgi:hypothetical protein